MKDWDEWKTGHVVKIRDKEKYIGRILKLENENDPESRTCNK